jgi:hypothetical protein
MYFQSPTAEGHIFKTKNLDSLCVTGLSKSTHFGGGAYTFCADCYRHYRTHLYPLYVVFVWLALGTSSIDRRLVGEDELGIVDALEVQAVMVELSRIVNPGKGEKTKIKLGKCCGFLASWFNFRFIVKKI